MNTKQFYKALRDFIKITLLSIIIFTGYFVFYGDILNERGLPVYIQLIFTPIFTVGAILSDTYGIFLLLPYVLFVATKYLLSKIQFKISPLIISTILILCVTPFILPRFLSCQFYYEDGFYKTDFQVCFGRQTGIYDGGTYSSNRVAGIDFKTFDSVGPYVKDKNAVYYSHSYPCYYDCIPYYYNIASRLSNADSKTFELISGRWAKDVNNIYFAGEIIEEIGLDSFVILDEFYVKDKNYVYKTGTDPDSREFKVFKIENADPDSFKVIKRGLAKDKNYVYADISIIKYIDPRTFEDLTGKYYKDKNHIYYYDLDYGASGEFNCRNCRIIEEVDMESFEVISEFGYAKDKNHVYKEGEILEGEDPKTFTP